MNKKTKLIQVNIRRSEYYDVLVEEDGIKDKFDLINEAVEKALNYNPEYDNTDIKFVEEILETDIV